MEVRHDVAAGSMAARWVEMEIGDSEGQVGRRRWISSEITDITGFGFYLIIHGL